MAYIQLTQKQRHILQALTAEEGRYILRRGVVRRVYDSQHRARASMRHDTFHALFSRGWIAQSPELDADGRRSEAYIITDEGRRVSEVTEARYSAKHKAREVGV